MRLRADRVELSAPSSITHLGSGEGAFSAALNLREQVTLRATAGTTRVIVEGEGKDSDPRDDTHPIIRGLRRGLEAAGAPQVGVYLHLVSATSRDTGLGATTTHLLLGLQAAATLVGEGSCLTADMQRDLAIKMGADPLRIPVVTNGGAALTYLPRQSISLRPPPLVAPVTFTPGFTAPPDSGSPPAMLTASEAALQSSRAGLLALLLGGVEVADSTEQFYQLLLQATSAAPSRAQTAEEIPAAASLTRWLREREVPAFITGRGPTVVSLTVVADSLVASAERSGWTVTQCRIDQRGMEIAAATPTV